MSASIKYLALFRVKFIVQQPPQLRELSRCQPKHYRRQKTQEELQQLQSKKQRLPSKQRAKVQVLSQIIALFILSYCYLNTKLEIDMNMLLEQLKLIIT